MLIIEMMKKINKKIVFFKFIIEKFMKFSHQKMNFLNKNL
tara:strand:- start:915 stop:1034 length:120 start_codon:yes stop_codon:yes gene_type:complete